VSERRTLRFLFGISLIITSLVVIPVFLSVDPFAKGPFYEWAFLWSVCAPFFLGLVVTLNLRNVKEIVEVITMFFVWSLIILVPLEGDAKNYVVSLWGLLLVVGYTLYSKKTRLKRIRGELYKKITIT